MSPDVLDPMIVPNGIDAVTGRYAVPQMTVADLAGALKEVPSSEVATEHEIERGARLAQRAFDRGLPFGVEPDNLAQAGWAVVYRADESPAVREALRPLVEHRLAQVGDAARVKELVYYPDESSSDWLRRYEVAWHNVEPTRVPYYLLWVGSPESMPFVVTHEIDSDYCVGLLDFDTADEYAQYARSVVAYETAASVVNRREVAYFGTRHPWDEATALSADWLVGALAQGVPANGATPAQPAVAPTLGFRQQELVNAGATRAALIDLLSRQAPPAIIFSATHGMVWPSGDPHQLAAQGALLCQDWPAYGSVLPQHYLAAGDVPDSAHVAGVIAFFFACYGAGTPKQDLYSFTRGQAPAAIAPRAFTAALPRRLLAHPAGGALACIGHVERAWGWSITGGVQGPQIRAFQNALAQLLSGRPAGLAVQEFNDLSATLANVLTRLLGDVHFGRPVSDVQLVSTWTQRNDAAGFVLIGDPAVRLRVKDIA